LYLCTINRSIQSDRTKILTYRTKTIVSTFYVYTHNSVTLTVKITNHNYYCHVNVGRKYMLE